MDGYPYRMASSNQEHGTTMDGACTLKRCFPAHAQSSEALFKWVLKEEPRCGDCCSFAETQSASFAQIVAVIHALIHRGRPGLEAFLPPADQKRAEPITFPQHLPLQLEESFSIRDILGPGFRSSRQIFTLRLLQRYAFSIVGEKIFTGSYRSGSHLERLLREMRSNKPSVSPLSQCRMPLLTILTGVLHQRRRRGLFRRRHARKSESTAHGIPDRDLPQTIAIREGRIAN